MPTMPRSKVRPLADILPDVADAFSRMADGPQKPRSLSNCLANKAQSSSPSSTKGKEGLGEMMKALRKRA